MELDIDRNVMNTIEEDHSIDHNCLHALVEVWLNGDPLTGIREHDLSKALQSQLVVSAMAGMSDSGMLRNIYSYLGKLRCPCQYIGHSWFIHLFHLCLLSCDELVANSERSEVYTRTVEFLWPLLELQKYHACFDTVD